MRRHGVGLVVAGLIVAGCSSSGSKPTTAAKVTVAGRVTVHDVILWIHHCQPHWLSTGDDVKAGVEVTVSDSAGKIVGLAPLGAPTRVGASFTQGGCVYQFGVQTPASPFFKVKVGSHNAVTVTAAEASDVAIRIG